PARLPPGLPLRCTLADPLRAHRRLAWPGRVALGRAGRAGAERGGPGGPGWGGRAGRAERGGVGRAAPAGWGAGGLP
ncbi:hypothetical protein AB0A74_42250, partial [Saccharothrix sp. NPDC042600]|uniref:hypothetical protein n=1 Tax=Saccharothrix sp. NPDC042600 TaxID=3154492 RepID=UPI0033E3691E